MKDITLKSMTNKKGDQFRSPFFKFLALLIVCPKIIWLGILNLSALKAFNVAKPLVADFVF